MVLKRSILNRVCWLGSSEAKADDNKSRDKSHRDVLVHTALCIDLLVAEARTAQLAARSLPCCWAPHQDCGQEAWQAFPTLGLLLWPGHSHGKTIPVPWGHADLLFLSSVGQHRLFWGWKGFSQTGRGCLCWE